MTVISSPHLTTAHAFAVSSGSHALRTYPNDARATLATSGRTLRSYAARNPHVCQPLWRHLKMRGFMRVDPAAAARHGRAGKRDNALNANPSAAPVVAAGSV